MFGENNIESESTYRDSLGIADRYPHCSVGLIFFFFYCLQVRNDAFNSLSHSKISSSPSTLEIAAAHPKAFTSSWCQFQQQSQHVAFPATAWVKTVVLRSSCRKLGSSSPVWWTGPSGSWLGTNILLGSQGKI